jgi:hypothetical protein
VQRDGGIEPTNQVNATEELDGNGFATSGNVEIGDLSLSITPIAFAPALLTHEGKVSRFPRALCGFATRDGREGLGWTEWNQPAV